MDLSAFADSLQRGFAAVPPIAIALVLLAGPTVALIGYRLVTVARRMQTSPEVEAAPLWVCHDCRSVNELRVSHCYRCGLGRDRTGDIEIVVDQPAIRRAPSEVPAGSPFAAVAGSGSQGPGVPVMTGRASPAQPVAVGPGRTADPAAAQFELESVDAAEAHP
jgi:hypothetical protein